MYTMNHLEAKRPMSLYEQIAENAFNAITTDSSPEQAGDIISELRKRLADAIQHDIERKQMQIEETASEIQRLNESKRKVLVDISLP
jgi:peptidoglycan hydrolase CwlO-like protein